MKFFLQSLELEVDYSQAYDENYRAGGGVTGGLLSSVTPRWKILATGSYLRFPLGESSEAFRGCSEPGTPFNKTWRYDLIFDIERTTTKAAPNSGILLMNASLKN